jgi:ribonuclease J
MKARIHRGANEVGGSCIELDSAGQRLVLDLGRPISARRDELVPLPAVEGLEQEDRSLVGLAITHPHLDHYGLSPGVDSSVPIFMGKAAHRLLVEATFFTGGAVPPVPTMYLRHREPFTVGPFTITPFLNDHSAFDAYSLLVEADGRRLFYTGDVRGHGRKRGIFEQLLRDPPGVDVLLMEGTNIREGAGADLRGPSETDVEISVAELARKTPGVVLAAFSPQNVDRLVTMFRAAVASGRELVLDLYGATVAAATRLSTIPQATWDRVRVYLPRSQRARVIKHKDFARTAAVHAARIYPEELRARSGELIMLFRGGMARELAAAECLDGAHAVWSMWPGYLRDESGAMLQEFLKERSIPMTVHHSSGHAFVPDLRRLVDAFAPERVVPIHSFAGDRFSELFARVDRKQDGEWWDV